MRRHRRSRTEWRALGVLAACLSMAGLLGGCPEDGSDDPSVQCTLFQQEDGTWTARVITKHQDDASYWDGFEATAGGETLVLTNDALERYDGTWSEYQVPLDGDLNPGDEVLFELSHPDLGSIDVAMTVCDTIEGYETDPPFDEWAARAVDGDPGNDTLTVTTDAPGHATDLMASLMLYETTDGAFGSIPFPVEDGYVAAYVETTEEVVLPRDADGEEWSTFWTTLSDHWEDCAALSIQLYVHWQWDDYLTWGDGLVIEAKHATVGLRDEIPLVVPSGGSGAWLCDCTCHCETCDGDTSGTEYGTDLTCDDVCPGVCDQASELCGSYTGSADGECAGPIDAPADVADCGSSLPPSTGSGAACTVANADAAHAPDAGLLPGLALGALALARRRRSTLRTIGVSR